MTVTLPAAGIIGAQCGNYCRYVGYSAEKRSLKGNGLAFCGFLYQAIGIMSSYDNAQKARNGRKSGGKIMAQFRLFEMNSIPIEEQFMNWKEIVKPP